MFDLAGYAQRIEDYALIGDCRSAALVSRAGSIDWLCLPRFDSAACFAALLGTPEHGRWLIAPATGGPVSAGHVRVTRSYRPGTMILETVFETGTGSVALIDFMPRPAEQPAIIRIVEGRRGRVDMILDLALRFDYGASVPWVTQIEPAPAGGAALRAVAGPDQLALYASVPLEGVAMRTKSAFSVSAGDQVTFALVHGPSQLPPPLAPDIPAALMATEAVWTAWNDRCGYQGEWREIVTRSLLTLKALTYAPTGGIVAAPTTSLPEFIGGSRNWDYRYCWLRDATITLLAMMHGGHQEEARAWRDWLRRSIAGSPEQLQIMYGIGGERRLAEWEVSWLPGYEGSSPVRIGNAAAGQLQLDVFGEVMDALYQARKAGLAPPEDDWDLQVALIEYLEKVWEQPDEGIWEVRGGRRHFVFSKVAAWMAMDRAVRSIEEFGLPGPIDRWREVRARIHEDVCRNGFDAAKNSFVQSYGDTALDASLLLIPLVGFLAPEDSRVQGTVAAIERELMAGGLLLRYHTDGDTDGLPPGEGVFLACSFWLVDNMVLQGRYAEARALFERLVGLANDVGLLAEEFDPRTGRLVGNFPQAFSHVALIDSAFMLLRAGKPVWRGDGMDD